MRVHSEEGFGMRTHIYAFRKVIGLFLRVSSDQLRMFLHLVYMKRQPVGVVEDFGKPPEARMCSRVSLTHD